MPKAARGNVRPPLLIPAHSRELWRCRDSEAALNICQILGDFQLKILHYIKSSTVTDMHVSAATESLILINIFREDRCWLHSGMWGPSWHAEDSRLACFQVIPSYSPRLSTSLVCFSGFSYDSGRRFV